MSPQLRPQAVSENGSPGQSSEPTDDELLELLDAEYTRAILETIREEPMPARAIAVQCGASRPTVYRRLEGLVRAGLVDSTMRYDPDGHHRAVFEATLESVSVDLDADGVSLSVSTEPSDSSRSTTFDGSATDGGRSRA